MLSLSFCKVVNVFEIQQAHLTHLLPRKRSSIDQVAVRVLKNEVRTLKVLIIEQVEQTLLSLSEFAENLVAWSTGLCISLFLEELSCFFLKPKSSIFANFGLRLGNHTYTAPFYSLTCLNRPESKDWKRNVYFLANAKNCF